MSKESVSSQTKNIGQKADRAMIPHLDETIEDARTRFRLSQGLEEEDRDLIPGLYERMEDARIRVRESKGKPGDSLEWDDRRAREFRVPKPISSRERIRQGGRIVATGAAVVALAGITGEGIRYGLDLQNKHLAKQEQSDRKAKAKFDKEVAQELGRTSHSP